MKQGDIVLIPFPFTNLKGAKRRPALVISGSNINRGSDIILVAITSKSRGDNFSISIDNQVDLNTPLHLISEIRCNKIFVADKGLVEKNISSVKSDILKRVVEKINSLFIP